MDIGTSKPDAEELKVAPHRLIDIRDPSECYSLSDFFWDSNSEVQSIVKSGRVPLLVGGTMLYFKILLQGLFYLPQSNQTVRNDLIYEAQKTGWINMYNNLKYIDPNSADIIHVNDHKRIIRALEIFFISGKTWTEWKLNSNYKYIDVAHQYAIAPKNRDILNEKIKKRYYRMLEMGFENEARILFDRSDLHKSINSSIFCTGYRQMWQYFSGKISYNEMILQGISATKKVAKRQFTWLRKWSNLHWLNSDDMSRSIDIIAEDLDKNFNHIISVNI